MTNLRNLLLTIAALSILPCAAARADNLSITFDPAILSAQPGQTITFSGTITNLENVAVDLNGCDVNIPGQFTADCSLFLSNAPFFLDPLETSFVFDMFTVTVDQPYTGSMGLQPPGTFTLLGGLEPPGGGYDGGTQNLLGEAQFAVIVTPEPGTAVMLGLALTLTFTLSGRKRRVEG
jgi:plastocyanin